MPPGRNVSVKPGSLTAAASVAVAAASVAVAAVSASAVSAVSAVAVSCSFDAIEGEGESEEKLMEINAAKKSVVNPPMQSSWKCDHCTFVNESEYFQWTCEMCSSPNRERRALEADRRSIVKPKPKPALHAQIAALVHRDTGYSLTFK